MAGFNGLQIEPLSGSYFTLLKGFNGFSGEPLNTSYFTLLKGFNGFSAAARAIAVQSVVVVDNIGNVASFAITNASLEDISGKTESKPLTFLPNVWTAQETNFFFGFDQGNIRLNFDISGLSASGNPFNLSFVEKIPQINVLP